MEYYETRIVSTVQKGLEDLRASRAGDGQRVWSLLGQADAALASLGFSHIRGGDATPEAGVVLHLLDSAGRKISQLEEAVGSRLEEKGRALAQAVADHMLMCLPGACGARDRRRVCGG
jgi:hypothetical protein